jgi:hypothetical protein
VREEEAVEDYSVPTVAGGVQRASTAARRR